MFFDFSKNIPDMLFCVARQRVQRVGVEHEGHFDRVASAATSVSSAGERPSPGPTTVTSASNDSRSSIAPSVIRPASSSGIGHVMYSAPSAATTGTHDFGVATVTSPAPERSAPIADSTRLGLPHQSGDDQHATELALV